MLPARKYQMYAFTLSALVLAVCPSVAYACETCFGVAVESEVTRGIGLAMLLLLVVVTFVFAGILWFFKNTMDRSRMLRDGQLTPPRHSTLLPPTALN